jgi:two-component system, chemotaxis family, chemotaxis protein CheY
MSNENYSILVAEDNAALATVVRFNLERAGFKVTVAPNGRRAWEAAQAGHFDLVVTDFQMPEMTGQDLATCLRGCDQYRETPIIMLTAKGLEFELTDIREELGITATFSKPFSPKEVVKAVEDHLSGVCK